MKCFSDLKYSFSYQNSIKMCTNVNHKDLITVHHEMMHVQYFLSYRHQPKVFRDGANPGKPRTYHFHRLILQTGKMHSYALVRFIYFLSLTSTFGKVFLCFFFIRSFVCLFDHLNSYNCFPFQSIRLLVLS